MAGWLSRARRCRPAGHRRRRSRRIAWAPDSGFKKIAENARKRRFQFPENRGKNGNRVEKNRPVRPAGPRRTASVSTCDYCCYYGRRRRPHSLAGRRRGRVLGGGGARAPRPAAVAAVGWYPGTIARISSAKCDPSTCTTAAAANSAAPAGRPPGRRSRVGRGFYSASPPPPPVFTRRRRSLAIAVAYSACAAD